MELFSEKSQCCGCTVCADICPQNAIHMQPDTEGFSYPAVRQELCTDCGRCKTVCPLSGAAPKTQRRRYFAAQALDQPLREASTSGGVFPVLADYVLDRGGAVYGAAFDHTMGVTHQRVSSRGEVRRLVQTKYVQSETAGIFRFIQQDLNGGRLTLFVGTPCQTEALRRFLPHKYPNLLLADLICYGVPSPGVWRRYIKYLEHRYHGRLTLFCFRDKARRNNGRTVRYRVGGKEYLENHPDNPYLSMYFSNCILRPSCHSCPFATVERNSDLTLGDFWGIATALPQLDDRMGTSLVILHSEKGEQLWNCVRDRFRSAECGKEQALQPRLLSPTPPSSARRLFFTLYRTLPFSALAELFCHKRSRRFWYEKKGGS